MTVRHYLSEVEQSTLDGVTAFRPVVRALLPLIRWHRTDGRADMAQAAGRMIVWADVSDAQHATLTTDPRVVALPFAGTGGVPIDVDAPISTMTAANRTALGTRLEAQGIPTAWATGATTPREILRFAIRRLLLRQHLRDDDWNEGLDTLVSAIPAVKRGRIAARLQSLGVDTSVIVGSDTLRDVMRKVLVQEVPALRSPFD